MPGFLASSLRGLNIPGPAAAAGNIPGSDQHRVIRAGELGRSSGPGGRGRPGRRGGAGRGAWAWK